VKKLGGSLDKCLGSSDLRTATEYSRLWF